ncbi:JM74 [macacine gammaherpesvirus 11]|uniref:JM74 n=2 Tax=macacine gammaherpesvirus 11 TaxID=2560570 RepID=G9JM82_9GAMA|nr:JM74 [Macaca fuscata rhadinovirus]AAT00051.1 JM74 [Macaca fuscata rhadinovirus]AEW87599.1 JM74 [Macaca fuscata rhadinovirus]AEW87769.1 JM74 [Macaca fuscata rhadinovirus]
MVSVSLDMLFSRHAIKPLESCTTRDGIFFLRSSLSGNPWQRPNAIGKNVYPLILYDSTVDANANNPFRRSEGETKSTPSLTTMLTVNAENVSFSNSPPNQRHATFILEANTSFRAQYVSTKTWREVIPAGGGGLHTW